MSIDTICNRSIILALIITVAGCTLPDEFNPDKYNKTIEWEPGISAPIAYGEFSIKDILTEFDSSGFVSEDDSGFLYFAYDTDASVNIQDVLPELTNQYFTHVFFQSPVVIPSAIWGAPGDTSILYTQDKTFKFSRYGDERLDSIILKAGEAVIDISSSIQNRGILTIHSNDLILGGQPYMQTLVVSDASGSFTDQVIIDLAGSILSLDNTTHPDTTYMDLNFDFYVINDENDIQPSQMVDIMNTFRNLEFEKAFGYAGSFDSLLVDQSMDFDFLGDDFEGSVSLQNPQINIDVQNSFGMKFGIKMQDIEGRFADGSTTMINLDPTIDTIVINAPDLLTQVGETVPTILTIDSSNSNMADLATTDLRGLDFSARAIGNPLGDTSNFLLDSSHMDLTLEVLVPMNLKIEDVVMKDTFEFEIPDSLGETELDPENFVSMFVQLDTKNGLPLEVEVQVYFVDSLWAVQDSLFDDSNRKILPSGILDPGGSGKVITRNEESVTVTVDRDMIENIWDVENIIFEASLQTTPDETTGDPEFVKLYSGYSLYFKVAAGAEISITLEDSDSK